MDKNTEFRNVEKLTDKKADTGDHDKRVVDKFGQTYHLVTDAIGGDGLETVSTKAQRGTLLPRKS